MSGITTNTNATPNGGELSDAEIDRSSVKVLAFRWLSRQGVIVVLLFAILSAIGWFGWYTMTTAIPKHLETIQDGYERVTRDHAAGMEKMAASIEKVVDDSRAQRKEFLDLLREYRSP
jgi:predicted negative regulator of RcsB-dependent stress response